MNRFLVHVNALRGVAILLVFLYHLRQEWCPQGFLGVDVFFVLAGYFLIPPLFRKMESDQFSWWQYYKGKGLRVFPPLLMMVIVTMAVAIPFMVSTDLFMVASTARTVITGLSNVYLGLVTIDYFAPGVRENVFLHTWYISVLMQVLVVAPLICLPLCKLGRLWSYFALAVCLIFSFIIFFQHWLPQEWQNDLPSYVRDGGVLGALYYMTAGRLWEILAGALVGLLPSVAERQGRGWLLVMGLLMIVIPAFWHENYSCFALLSVVGTMFVVRYGDDTSVDSIFRNKFFMWLGTVSFSLYLVHWPVMALTHYVLMSEFSLIAYVWGVVVTVTLTYAMHRWVETKRWSIWMVALLWVAIMGVAWGVRKTNGLVGMIHPSADKIPLCTSTEYQDWRLADPSDWIHSLPNALNPASSFYAGKEVTSEQSGLYGRKAILTIGNAAKTPNFILIGDSYANSLFPGLDCMGKKEDWSGLYLNSYVVPIWDKLNTFAQRDIELQFNEKKAEALMDWLAKNDKIKFVILHQCWWSRFSKVQQTRWNGEKVDYPKAFDFAVNGLRLFCAKICAMGKTPILVLPTPESSVEGSTNIGNLQKRYMIIHGELPPRGAYSTTRTMYEEQNRDIIGAFQKMEKEGLCYLVDPTKDLFQNGVFDPVRGNELIVYDHGHLSAFGSTLIVRGIRAQLLRVFKSGDANAQEESSGISSEE